MKVPLLSADTTRRQLVRDLDNFFRKEMGFKKLYNDNFSDMRVSEIHPFAVAIFNLDNGKEVPQNLFPSVTVSRVEESQHQKSPIGNPQFTEVTAELIQEYKDLGKERIISEEQLKKIEDAFSLLEEGDRMNLETYVDIEKYSIIYTLWTDNFDVKEQVYDAIKHYVRARVQFFTDLGMNEISWTGDRDGLYNMDFGKLLYGATVTMRVSQGFAEQVIDLEKVRDPEVVAKIWEITSVQPGDGFFFPQNI